MNLSYFSLKMLIYSHNQNNFNFDVIDSYYIVKL